MLRSFTSGLEQFDYVAGRVFQQDLLTAWTGDNVVSEREARVTQLVHLGSDIAHDEVNTVPSPIQGAQDPEIKKMEGWLMDWNKPLTDEGMSGMDHGSDEGDSMVGMMSDDDMKSLERDSGAEFDTMFLTMMIRHHKGAITMAETEIAKGKNADAIALAKTIKDAQTGEIATIEDLLRQ